MITDLNEQLQKVEEKIAELRIRWREASPSRKKAIEVIAKIKTDERDELKRRLENL